MKSGAGVLFSNYSPGDNLILLEMENIEDSLKTITIEGKIT